MKKLLDQNLDRLRKQVIDSDKALVARHREKKSITSSLENHKRELEGFYENKSTLKRDDIVADLMEYRDVLELIDNTQESIISLSNQLIECEKEIEGLNRLLDSFNSQIAGVQEELKGYGQIIQFPEPNDGQGFGVN